MPLGPVFISPNLFDKAVLLGIDMSGYRKTSLIPADKNAPLFVWDRPSSPPPAVETVTIDWRTIRVTLR